MCEFFNVPSGCYGSTQWLDIDLFLMNIGSLNQEPNAYPIELAWHVKVTFFHASLHFLHLDDSPRINRV